MKVLLLAPQPFYQERGTPIAVDLVLRALSARGDAVDVLTYFEGTDVSYPGVRIHRILRLPWVRHVAPGPSLKKVLCDLVLFITAIHMATRTRYDMVHAVEESVFIALLIRRLFGIPYLYDMDSHLAGQLTEKYRALAALGPVFRWAEGAAIRHAEAVMPVCDALADVAARHRPRRLVVLRDISLLSLNGSEAEVAPGLKDELGLMGPVAMYVGNLERYQGIDLLLESFALAKPRVPTARLVIVGGHIGQIQHYEQMAKRLGLDGAVHFVGPRPVSQMAAYLAAADVLVSPRLVGNNTPMKIYSYLDSGRVVLATALPTHTQLLTDEVALLASPTPDAFADGLVRLMQDEGLRRRLGASAQALVAQRHRYEVFKTTLEALYAELERAQEPNAFIPQQTLRAS